MSNWKLAKNDGWEEIDYQFGLGHEDGSKLSVLLNEACHVYHCHAEGVWESNDKDAYATKILQLMDKYPELESRLLRSSDRVIKMLVYRAIELR